MRLHGLPLLQEALAVGRVKFANIEFFDPLFTIEQFFLRLAFGAVLGHDPLILGSESLPQRRGHSAPLDVEAAKDDDQQDHCGRERNRSQRDQL